MARSYWVEIQKILKYDLPLCLDLYLLGFRMSEIDKEDRVSLWYMLSAAWQLYAKKWKLADIPTLEEWRLLLLKYAELDKLVKKLDGKTNKNYIQSWGKVKF